MTTTDEPRPQPNLDLVAAVRARPAATLCLHSALAEHDLTGTVPDKEHLAIPRGTSTPRSMRAVHWHTFDARTFTIGRHLALIADSDAAIGLYSPERSIVDAYRLRSIVGRDVARSALKLWLARGGEPMDLLAIAQEVPRAAMPLLADLEVLR